MSESQLLRFSTAGSVDDGKSTLIGRLLFEAKGVYEDQMAALQKSSIKRDEESEYKSIKIPQLLL